MTEFTVSLAGVPMRIEALSPRVADFCRDYITSEKPLFTVSMTPEDIARERERSAREDELEGKPVRRFSDAYLETLAVYRRLAERMLDYDAVVFHGSVVALEGRAYLFTARSGTGKTTHTRLWLKNIPGSYVLNGDKPMLRLDGARVLACGTPWMGKERLGCRGILPLEAICLLERDEKNRIEPISFHEAMAGLIQQTHRPEGGDAFVKTLSLIGKLGGCVRLYRLGCNMEDEAALVSWRGMTGGENGGRTHV